MGEPVGEWVTYDSEGKKYKASERKHIVNHNDSNEIYLL